MSAYDDQGVANKSYLSSDIMWLKKVMINTYDKWIDFNEISIETVFCVK